MQPGSEAMKYFHVILATELTIIFVAALWAIVEVSKTHTWVLFAFHSLITIVILLLMFFSFKQNVFDKKKK